MAMKRTTINIDIDLVDRARVALGTANMTETITQALEHAVRAAALERLATWKIDMTIQELERVRVPRPLGSASTTVERDAS